MTTRHLVDPELVAFLDQNPRVQLTRAALPSIRSARAEMARRQITTQPEFPDIDVFERRVSAGLSAAGAPDVRVVVYQPRNLPRPVPALLWIHGGGYVMGNTDSDDLLLKTIVKTVGCAVASVDYRLAPEAPFPASIDDCYAALKWLVGEATELGVLPNRVAIGGSSAGGGLTAALGLLARDRGEVPIAFQLLLVPMLDDRTTTTTDPHPHVGEFGWTAESNLFGWSALLGHAPGGEGVSPYASPARAESLAGLPSTFISSGALDLFLEEDMEYARRLVRAGVPTELHIYPGAYHGFGQTPEARVTQAYKRDFMQALWRALHTNQRVPELSARA